MLRPTRPVNRRVGDVRVDPGSELGWAFDMPLLIFGGTTLGELKFLRLGLNALEKAFYWLSNFRGMLCLIFSATITHSQ